jgi:hypothetical protein
LCHCQLHRSHSLLLKLNFKSFNTSFVKQQTDLEKSSKWPPSPSPTSTPIWTRVNPTAVKRANILLTRYCYLELRYNINSCLPLQLFGW